MACTAGKSAMVIGTARSATGVSRPRDTSFLPPAGAPRGGLAAAPAAPDHPPPPPRGSAPAAAALQQPGDGLAAERGAASDARPSRSTASSRPPAGTDGRARHRTTTGSAPAAIATRFRAPDGSHSSVAPSTLAPPTAARSVTWTPRPRSGGQLVRERLGVAIPTRRPVKAPGRTHDNAREVADPEVGPLDHPHRPAATPASGDGGPRRLGGSATVGRAGRDHVVAVAVSAARSQRVAGIRGAHRAVRAGGAGGRR
jgi:hypothetical protein